MAELHGAGFGAFRKFSLRIIDFAWYALCLVWCYFLFYPFLRFYQLGRFEQLKGSDQLFANSLSLFFELIAVYIGLFSLVAVSFSLWKLLKALISGTFFEKETVKFVKLLGFSVLTFGLMPLYMASGQMISRFLSSPVRLTHDATGGEIFKIQFLFLIVTGIIVYIISILIQRIADLREEQRLTV